MEDEHEDVMSLVMESLEKGELDSVVFLLEGESEQLVEKIRNSLTNRQQLEILEAAIVERNKNQEKEHFDDKIRNIRAGKENSESSNESQIYGLLQKPKKKINKSEEKFGYPFYGVVKSLMISYGDLSPIEKTVKMMHSQVQTLFSKVFDRKIKQKLSSTETIKYLAKIFANQFQEYEKFMKVYKQATKGTKKEQDSDDDFLSEDSEPEIDHCASFSDEEKKYFVQITTNMSLQQYEKYTENRSENFIQNKRSQEWIEKFKKFIDSQNVADKNMKILNLLSFLCCRFIKNIIFQIIKQDHGNKLVFPFPAFESAAVTEVGNEFIDSYMAVMNDLNSEMDLFENQDKEKAKEVFIEQFHPQGYRQLLPRRIIVEGQREGDHQLPINVWNQNKHYQKMWMERVKSEKEISEKYEEFENGNLDPTHEYSKFILKHYKVYQEKGGSFLWRKYFTNEPIESENSGKRKRVKLESLNS